jgi:4-amino-4-deoxy-L-arabinose transferase-like glycosyltransferase
MAALIALNAVYWPFHDDDAVSIYAFQSRQIYQTGDLPTGEGLYEAYPMLLPLSHDFSYLLAGEVNEYLAKIAVAALGIGTLGAAVVLGRALYDANTGLIAGVLLATTPMVARWASSGYTDIPAAFFVTLAALFGWWLREHGTARDALLLGVMAGLAAWTKNSTLVLAGSVGLWVLYLTLRYLDRVTWDRIVWCAFGGAITAGPWYLRNLAEFGYVVPKTVWVDLADRTAANAIPFVMETNRYFLSGIVFTAGIAHAIYDVARGDAERQDRALLLLIMVLPFGAAWWWVASYDSRFLLAVLPLIAVMGAHLLARIWRGLWREKPALNPALQIALALLLVALAIPAARKAVSFKGEMLRDPFMDDTQRHQIALGPVYDVALYLNALPAGGQILSNSYFLPFHVDRAGETQVIVGGLPSRDALAAYDYVVTSAGARLFTAIEESDVKLLTEIGGFKVYRVVYEQD